MQQEISYKRLRELAREEKSQPSLVALPPDFYEQVSAFLSSKFAELESSHSVMSIHEFENAIAVVREISSIRRQKILFRAIRSEGSHEESGLMTKEEHELYDRFCAVLEDAQNGIEKLLLQYGSRKASSLSSQKPDVPEPGNEGSTPAAPASSLKKVRFLKEVPAYKGPNNETFGPFKPGDEWHLPQSEAEWLMKGRLAEIVE
jgi:DNA replication initiation complex subunit (GINS family)